MTGTYNPDQTPQEDDVVNASVEDIVANAIERWTDNVLPAVVESDFLQLDILNSENTRKIIETVVTDKIVTEGLPVLRETLKPAMVSNVIESQIVKTHITRCVTEVICNEEVIQMMSQAMFGHASTMLAMTQFIQTRTDEHLAACINDGALAQAARQSNISPRVDVTLPTTVGEQPQILPTLVVPPPPPPSDSSPSEFDEERPSRKSKKEKTSKKKKDSKKKRKNKEE